MTVEGSADNEQADDLLGRWLAHHRGYADTTDPAAEQRDIADGHRPEDGGSAEAVEAMATAGAILQAFAAGTLEVAGDDAEDRGGDQPDSDAEQQPEPEAAVTPTEATQPEAVLPRPAAAAESVPHDIRFRPRTTTRSAVSLLLLASVVATGRTAWQAYDEPTTSSIRLAVALGVLTVILWAVRARTTVAHLAVTGNRLEIVRSGARMVFDLDDPHTEVQVVGTPGKRGWKVVIPRRSLSPTVIDARMVDPREFTRAVELRRAPAEPRQDVSAEMVPGLRS
jgi:hypothetical protein